MTARDWIDWSDEICQPVCELPQLTGRKAARGDVEVCDACGLLWRFQSVTEYECDEIDGEPIPGSFTPIRTVDGWVSTR